jgi:hypothetical protein
VVEVSATGKGWGRRENLLEGVDGGKSKKGQEKRERKAKTGVLEVTGV